MKKVPSIRDYLILDRRTRENPAFRATSNQNTVPELNLAYIMNTCLQLEKTNNPFDGFYWTPGLSWPFGNIQNTIELSNSPLSFLNPYRLNTSSKLERLFKTLDSKSLLISLSIFPQEGRFASYFELFHHGTQIINHYTENQDIRKKLGHSAIQTPDFYGIVAFYSNYRDAVSQKSEPRTPQKQQQNLKPQSKSLKP